MTDTCTRCEREPELVELEDGYCNVCHSLLEERVEL